MTLFDTHAHYIDSRFEEEYEGGAAALIPEVFASGVSYVVNVGTNPENSLRAIEQVKKYEGMYAAVGIHPTDGQYLKGTPDEELAKIRALLEKREENKIVALGEIGFDYHYDDTDKPLQTEYFERQINLALEYDLPVIIHDRDAHGDCFDTVRKYPELRGVFHSYSGSREMAIDLVRRGWYISFSGVISFKNAPRVREVAQAMPADRILIETDCPYLAPVPYRGKLNHSGLMRHTLAALADARGEDEATLAEQLMQNSRRLFGIA
ncbi:MAG: TatD family hydrolase [Clostridia bacterium]|nr:TatD family hydrolase [Clostridia bacterium]